MAKTTNMDMTNGPLTKKIVLFSIPLILSGMLQLLYNAADVIVVGRWAGSAALAAVGSTGALINLQVNLFIGVSVGCNVLVARFHGAGRMEDVRETVHCAVATSVVAGLIGTVIGQFLSVPLLRLMGSPDDVLPLASLYLRIYFFGMPFNIAYNFGAAVLRAVGDTKRPLYILSIAGIVNVLLNLLTVIVFDMGVAGVAVATVASQAVSAVLVLRCLRLREDSCHLEWREVRIYKDKLAGMIKIGLPAGIQSSLFSISNMIIQSSVNSFGSVVIAGNAAASNLEGFVYNAMNAVYQASITFTSQNLGAGKPKRILRVMGNCLVLVSVVGLVIGGLFFGFGHTLLGIYASDSEGLREAIISVGLTRMSYICAPYFICGLMEIGCGGMRGLGWSWVPTTVTLLGACGLRIVWISTVFSSLRTLDSIYVSYPISWIVTFVTHMICFFFAYRKTVRQMRQSGTLIEE